MVFLLAILFLPFSLEANQGEVFAGESASVGYTCNVDEECLNYLNNTFLNEESEESIYQVCKLDHQNIRDCCSNFMECNAPYVNGGAQKLKNNSLNLVEEIELDPLSCELNKISDLVVFSSFILDGVCEEGIKTCKTSCENKLEDFKQTFRKCFSIQSPHTIDSVLEEAKNFSDNSNCYKEITDVAEKYRKQSFYGISLFKEELKAEDIVDCSSIKEEINQENLDKLALNICYQAQEQKQQEQEEQQEFIEPVKPKEVEEQTSQVEPQLEVVTNSFQAQAEENNQVKSQSFYEDNLPQSKQTQMIENLLQSDPAQVTGNLLQSKQVQFFLEEPFEGFFSRGVEKVKSLFKKIVDAIKDLLPFVDSERETVAKVLKLCREVSSPFRLSQMLYQSVKAPQIERLDKEDGYPNDNYDLVRNKPAGVIVRILRKGSFIRGFQEFDFDAEENLEKMEFSLSLKINDRRYRELLCSKNLKGKDVRYRSDSTKPPEEVTIETKAEYCKFNWSDFKDKRSIYKFISLPTEPNNLLGTKLGSVNIEILSRWKHKDSTKNSFITDCESSRKFAANILEPIKFKTLFTGINAPHCGDKDDKGNPQRAYETTKLKDVKNYLESREVRQDFYDMFPVVKRGAKRPEFEMLLDNKGNRILLPGNCGRKKDDGGLYEDLLALKGMNTEYGSDRMVAVFKKSYKKHHTNYFAENPKISGFVFHKLPVFRIRTFSFLPDWFLFFIRKGSDVTLVQEGRENHGIFLHELAHTFGQRKEHYLKENHKNSSYCDQFTSKRKLPKKGDSIPCFNYRVTGGMVREENTLSPSSKKPVGQIWKLLNNQSSIMHGGFEIRGEHDNYQKWIDRETYQKALATLDNDLKIPKDLFNRVKGQSLIEEPRLIQVQQKYENLMNCNSQKRPVITVSGIYSKEKSRKSLLTDFSAKAFEIKNHKNPFSGGEFFIGKREEETNHIIVQLERNGKVEEEMVFSRDAFMEVFYEDGRIERKEMDSFPLYASFFPACGTFNKDDYKTSVKEIYMEDGIKKERILIDSVPIQWEKETYVHSPHSENMIVLKKEKREK